MKAELVVAVRAELQNVVETDLKAIVRPPLPKPWGTCRRQSPRHGPRRRCESGEEEGLDNKVERRLSAGHRPDGFFRKANGFLCLSRQ